MRLTGMFKRDFYQSYPWRKVRAQALKKYGAVCMKCGSTENIEVDHVLPRSLYPGLKLKLYNLQILCREHNRKKGLDHNDYRPIPIKVKFIMIKKLKKLAGFALIIFFGQLLWMDVAYHPFNSTFSYVILSDAQEFIGKALESITALLTAIPT